MLNILTASSNGITEFFTALGEVGKEIFSSFTFFDVIDIFLLSTIFFFLLRFIRGRKAGVLMVGVSILLVITGIAYVLDLRATYTFFNAIFKVGVIALFIIFQPEIRDALERVGTGSIHSIMSIGEHKKKNDKQSKVIEQVTHAVGMLSASKTGALIVIARTTKLDDLYDGSIALNADVSSELIRNIFYNKAPLHDGAIIIENGKITAAACIISNNTRRSDLTIDLGTRHRAALGLSELSDAIIIIVSEETGTISTAHESNLQRDYTVDTLRKYLNTKLLKRRDDTKGN